MFLDFAVASFREFLRECDIYFLEFGELLNIDLFLEGRRVSAASEVVFSERAVVERVGICLSGMVNRYKFYFVDQVDPMESD